MYLGAAAFVLWGLPRLRGVVGVIQWVGRIASLAGLAMLQARTVLVASFMACLALIAHRDTRRRGKILMVAASILVVGLGVLALHDPARLGRMVSGDDPRFMYWRLAASDVIANPMIGMGGQHAFSVGIIERWEVVNPESPIHWVVIYNAHNTPLNLAAFHGFPALALHVVALAAILLACWRRSRLALALSVFWIVCGCFDATFTEQRTAYVLAMTVALVLVWPRTDPNGLKT
jgi:hypothetical protein